MVNFIQCLVAALILIFPYHSLFAYDYGSIKDNQIVFDSVERQAHVRIRNWAENVDFTPELLLTPKNKTELLAIVNHAKRYQKRITMIGKGHSWNPLMEGADYLVSTVKLKQVWVHAEEKAVTVEAGATIDQVDKIIEQHGFMVPCNIVGTTDITYGGIMATGSHGSGLNCPTMSDFIEEIEFIKSDGTSELVSEKTHGALVMNAARLNLGLFGIMYSIKFKVQEAFNVHVVDQGVPLDNLFDILPWYLRSHENVEVLWFPLTDRVIIKSWNPTSLPENSGACCPKLTSDITKWALYRGFTPLIRWFMEVSAGRISGLADFIGPRLFPDREYVENVNDAIHYVNEAVVFPINETEIAIPYDFNDLDRVRMGWEAMVEAAFDNARQGKYSLNIIAHMRFTKSSRALLSPSFANKRTCYMDYGSFYKTPGWRELVNQIWQTWGKIPDVKLHWAKDMRAYDSLDIRKMYGKENVEKFLAVRKQFDPAGMFANDFLRKMFKIEN